MFSFSSRSFPKYQLWYLYACFISKTSSTSTSVSYFPQIFHWCNLLLIKSYGSLPPTFLHNLLKFTVTFLSNDSSHLLDFSIDIARSIIYHYLHEWKSLLSYVFISRLILYLESFSASFIITRFSLVRLWCFLVMFLEILVPFSAHSRIY